MLKKILIILLIFFSISSNTFAYNLTKKDKKILNKIYIILDDKFKNKVKLKKLSLKIKKIKPKFFIEKNKKKLRIYYLLDSIERYINRKLLFGNNLKPFSKIQNEQDIYFKKVKIYGTNLVYPDLIKKVYNKQDNEIKNKTFIKSLKYIYKSNLVSPDKIKKVYNEQDFKIKR